MRYILAIVLAAMPLVALAKPVLVLNWSPQLKIVLTEDNCNIKNFKGKAARVQHVSGNKVHGCWVFVNDHQHVRIEWNNPQAPGDFAVLRFGDFKILEDEDK
jgi:hypothetical protein